MSGCAWPPALKSSKALAPSACKLKKQWLGQTGHPYKEIVKCLPEIALVAFHMHKAQLRHDALAALASKHVDGVSIASSEKAVGWAQAQLLPACFLREPLCDGVRPKMNSAAALRIYWTMLTLEAMEKVQAREAGRPSRCCSQAATCYGVRRK